MDCTEERGSVAHNSQLVKIGNKILSRKVQGSPATINETDLNDDKEGNWRMQDNEMGIKQFIFYLLVYKWTEHTRYSSNLT